MKKVVGLMLGLFPVSVSAECVPVPDCASIGYTETSCEGDSIKCPFDTTRLYCPPCDSSFRYTCSGDNIKNPIGDTCNNKYVACDCVAGAIFLNGECICESSCKVGNIYYSDGSCNSCLDENKTPIGIVIKENDLIVAFDIPAQNWAITSGDVNGIYNYSSANEAIKDFDGINNTISILNHYGFDSDTSRNAAGYCYQYYPSSRSDTLNSWYLPALGEAYNYIYLNFSDIKNALSILNIKLNNKYIWSSSEFTNTHHAWYIKTEDGTITFNAKYSLVALVFCVLKIG